MSRVPTFPINVFKIETKTKQNKLQVNTQLKNELSNHVWRISQAEILYMLARRGVKSSFSKSAVVF